jgi:lipoyl(octanoyl) transferase
MQAEGYRLGLGVEENSAAVIKGEALEVIGARGVLLVDLSESSRDARLPAFNIRGERRESRVGVWVQRPDKARGADGTIAEDKIAALGIRVRRWVTFHGLSINVEPDLGHFGGIVPCGVADPRYGVTSLVDLGLPVMTSDLDLALRSTFTPIFGPLTTEKP